MQTHATTWVMPKNIMLSKKSQLPQGQGCVPQTLRKYDALITYRLYSNEADFVLWISRETDFGPRGYRNIR